MYIRMRLRIISRLSIDSSVIPTCSLRVREPAVHPLHAIRTLLSSCPSSSGLSLRGPKKGQIKELIEDGWWRKVGAVKRKQRSLVYYISETEEGIQARLEVDRLILV